MAREKPLDVPVVQVWLAAWNERDVFSHAAVVHLQSFITDPLCLVVVTLGMGREPRSLVFRRIKRVQPVPTEINPEATLKRLEDMLPSMFVSPLVPVGPSVGQLWHQIGARYRVPRSLSKCPWKLERVLQWDGKDWVIAGYVLDSPTIMKEGKQVCDFQEALAYAHESTKWTDCEFIYTHDGSTWGNA